MTKLIDLTGKRFGRWTVIKRDTSKLVGNSRWVCRCDCGNIKAVRSPYLIKGASKSCGCLQREMFSTRRTTHGATKGPAHDPEYTVWRAMRTRCINPSKSDARWYSGISCCSRWARYENFLADMGKRPPGMTLERIENTRGYFPENCRWASRKEQARNRRSSLTYEHSGKTRTVAEIAEIEGLAYHQFYPLLRVRRMPLALAIEYARWRANTGAPLSDK